MEELCYIKRVMGIKNGKKIFYIAVKNLLVIWTLIYNGKDRSSVKTEDKAKFLQTSNRNIYILQFQQKREILLKKMKMKRKKKEI